MARKPEKVERADDAVDVLVGELDAVPRPLGKDLLPPEIDSRYGTLVPPDFFSGFSAFFGCGNSVTPSGST
jgi:hypothetical protein